LTKINDHFFSIPVLARLDASPPSSFPSRPTLPRAFGKRSIAGKLARAPDSSRSSRFSRASDSSRSSRFSRASDSSRSPRSPRARPSSTPLARAMTRVTLSLALSMFLFVAATATATATVLTDDDAAEASHYLRTYGFLENDENQQSSSLDNATSLSNALSLFQEYYGLPGNGILNVETIRVMRRPRCGVADIHAYSPLTRKWPKTHLTWNFRLAGRDTLRTTQTAFALWSEQSSLTFSRDTLRPDILISYQSGHAYENTENGDACPSPFAGPGAAVAHAFFPTGVANHVSEVHVDEKKTVAHHADETSVGQVVSPSDVDARDRSHSGSDSQPERKFRYVRLYAFGGETVSA